MLHKYFKKFFKQEEIKEQKIEDTVYKLYKDKCDIETIMIETNFNKMEIIEIIQKQKKIKRGE